jgi:hypothetical protein
MAPTQGFRAFLEVMDMEGTAWKGRWSKSQFLPGDVTQGVVGYCYRSVLVVR